VGLEGLVVNQMQAQTRAGVSGKENGRRKKIY
jgi:hypothetical protein